MKPFVQPYKILVTVLFLLCTPVIVVKAQQTPGEIRGKVMELESGEALERASVWIEIGGNKHGISTDSTGRFVIKPVSPGTYTLYASYINKTPYRTIVDVKPNQITFVPTISLRDSSEMEVEVFVYSEPLINPEETSMRTITYKEIKNSPHIRSLSKLVGSMTSDIKVSEDGRDSYVRGSRSDAAIYFVDGVKMMEGRINVPGVAIGSVTVYTGGVPAKYGDVTSGVIIVETKSYFDLYNDWKSRNEDE